MRKLQKICINYGVNGILDRNLIKISMNELKLITNQTPIITRSKKDISNFKLRKGMELGVKVTLRGRKMYHMEIIPFTVNRRNNIIKSDRVMKFNKKYKSRK